MTVKEIFKVEHTTSTEKLVLLFLQHKGCGEEYTEIKHEEIIKSCNISQSSVNRSLKGLENKGLIDVFYRRGHSLAKHIKIISNNKEV